MHARRVVARERDLAYSPDEPRLRALIIRVWFALAPQIQRWSRRLFCMYVCERLYMYLDKCVLKRSARHPRTPSLWWKPAQIRQPASPHERKVFATLKPSVHLLLCASSIPERSPTFSQPIRRGINFFFFSSLPFPSFVPCCLSSCSLVRVSYPKPGCGLFKYVAPLYFPNGAKRNIVN